ncbi:hypothetical protein [Pontibacter sp. G13]|uniref:hypothetical protein n=1 Tax=Pontibacter sp. G13 TaxID=3074898 RepID=UPI0028890A64|nr:hypothetical protein [Pontibacter sp. G13]WNJ19382.1 hypothetical protein RJD25_02720 [Pontibacter sp. G13]
MRTLFLFCSIMLLIHFGKAQEYEAFGMRFATDIQYFPRADESGLVTGTFTTGVLGVYYSNYKEFSGFQAGLNVNHKGGGFNLPVIMEDYGNDEQNTKHTSLEMDFKVGPRYKGLYAQIGYVLGYRFVQEGFLQEGVDAEINPWYLMLPFGLSTHLPTNWGNVGFGAYYNVGVLNMVKSPDQAINPDGGRQRYFSIEITVDYETSR